MSTLSEEIQTEKQIVEFKPAVPGVHGVHLACYSVAEAAARKSKICICGKPMNQSDRPQDEGGAVCWHCFKHREDVTPFKYFKGTYDEWVATLPNPLPNQTLRACDECGQVTDYEPLLCGAFDLMAKLPHFCQACQTAHKAAEEAAAVERQREKREAAWTATVPKKYRETITTHPNFPRAMWDALREWDLGKNIGLIGPSGRGKTRLLALLAKRAIAKDMFVGWCPATSFQWAAQNQWDDHQGVDAKKWLRRWQECAVLFLDDLGKHRWTEAVESEFFALIDLRNSRGMPIHWTMNPLPDDEPALVERLQLDLPGVIARALDPSGMASARPRFAPIVSRLIDEAEVVPVIQTQS